MTDETALDVATLLKNALAGRGVQNLKSDLRALLAVELKTVGWSYHDIARYFGIKPTSAKRLIKRGHELITYTMGGVLEQRNKDIHRIEMLVREWMPRALEGDPDATELTIKLLGLKGKFLRYDNIKEEDASAEIWRRIADFANRPRTAQVITIPRAITPPESQPNNG